MDEVGFAGAEAEGGDLGSGIDGGGASLEGVGGGGIRPRNKRKTRKEDEEKNWGSHGRN